MADAREIFNSIRVLKKEIWKINDREEDLRASMLPSGISYEKTKIKNSASDPMSRYVDKLSDLQEEKKEALSNLISNMLVAEDILAKMPTSKYRIVLYMRYEESHDRQLIKWEEIAKHLNYDEVYVRHDLHKEALAEAQQVLDSMLI